MDVEDIDKLKNQIAECYEKNKSFAHDSFNGEILKFQILVNEDKTIKELTTDVENPFFSKFLNKVFENPECNNLILPDDDYEVWEAINFSFDFSWQFEDWYEYNEKKSFNSINEVIQTIGEFKCEGFGKFEILEKDKLITKMNFSTGDSKIDLVINWGAAQCEENASIFSSIDGTEHTFITNIEDFNYEKLYIELSTMPAYNYKVNGIHSFWIQDWEIIKIEGDDIFPKKWNVVKILKTGHPCEDEDVIVSDCYDYHIFYSIFYSDEGDYKSYTDGINLKNGNVILKLPSATVDSNIILLPKKQQYDSLPNADIIEVFDNEILFESIKTYFDEGGAVWFDAVYDLEGEFIKYLKRDGDTACVPIEKLWEYEINKEAIEEQKISELCVWNWREDPGEFLDSKYIKSVKYDVPKDSSELEKFDFFDNGFNYHEASEYMINNSEENCFLFKGELIAFRYYNVEPFHKDYDEKGIKELIIAEDEYISVIKKQSPLCAGNKIDLEVYHNGISVIKINSEKGKTITPTVPVISKDYNDNGLKELLIDYCVCIVPYQNYLLFEYDEKIFNKIAHKEAYDWQDRLNISDYYENKILWEDDDLKKLIQNNLEKK